MSLYKGNNLISGAMPNSANQSLSNLNSAGQDKFDAKVDLDLTNVTNSAKVMMSGMGMPSNKHINLTLGASGSKYTAPANGWFYFLGSWSNRNTFILLENTSKSYKVQTVGITASGYWGLMLPIAKGDSCLVGYNTAPANVQFRFIYAQGSESEAQ